MKTGVHLKIASEAVKAKTGKTWAQWFAVLDKARGQAMSHKEIVAVLEKTHDIGPCGGRWWRSGTSRPGA